MALPDALNHLLNFVAPAAWLAVALPLLARVVLVKTGAKTVLWAQVAINFVASLAALGFSLWYFGHDGTMAGYAAMVLAGATSQWLMQAR